MIQAPVRYSDAAEKPIDNEEEVHRDLTGTMRSITEATSKDYGHAVRSVHAKAHGIIAGELVIEDGLPPELAQGLFSTSGSHPVIIRISTIRAISSTTPCQRRGVSRSRSWTSRVSACRTR